MAVSLSDSMRLLRQWHQWYYCGAQALEVRHRGRGLARFIVSVVDRMGQCKGLSTKDSSSMHAVGRTQLSIKGHSKIRLQGKILEDRLFECPCVQSLSLDFRIIYRQIREGVLSSSSHA